MTDLSSAVSVDLVVLTMGAESLDALVVWQSERWALPGGLLGRDEDLAGAAARYLAGRSVPRRSELMSSSSPVMGPLTATRRRGR